MGMMDKKKNKAQDGGGSGGGLGSLGGYSMPSGGGGGSTMGQRMSSSNMPNNSGSGVSFGGISSPVGKVFGPTIPIGDRGSFSVGANPFNRSAGANLRIPLGRAKGGTVKKMAKGGSTASKRADGCATKGKTKGRFV